MLPSSHSSENLREKSKNLATSALLLQIDEKKMVMSQGISYCINANMIALGLDVAEYFLVMNNLNENNSIMENSTVSISKTFFFSTLLVSRVLYQNFVL